MENLKIGFDAKRLFNNFTGLGNYSRTLLRNLATFHPNHDLNLYTPKLKVNNENQPFQNKEIYQIHTSDKLMKSLWRSYSITNDLKRDELNIYHGLSNEIPFTLKKTNIKSVVTIHDLIFKVYPKTYKPFDRAMYDYKFKKSCEQADKVIAISESTKRDIVHYCNINPNKIEVVYQSCLPIYFEETQNYPLNDIRTKYNLPKDYLLYVGSLIERKNVKLIIEALHGLPSNYQIPLVIIGNGNQKSVLVEIIQKYSLEKRVIWIDNLKDNIELKRIYQGAQVLIYPSVYEGFGLPVVEAMLCKTPVITSKVSSLPEAAGPSTLLIDPNQKDELINAIDSVLSKTDLRSKMIKDGFKYANQKFNPKTVTQNMVDIYKRLV